MSYALPKFYRNLALIFFLAAVIVLAFVFYLIWARVTITIFSNTEVISQEFIFDVSPGASGDANSEQLVINGRARSVEVQGSGNYGTSGSQTVESENVGEVNIINNYSQSQTLVETTRLAFAEDPDTVIVRLRNTVVVEPGQSISVPVYPEDPENFEALPAEIPFIIPGLWGPLQDRIFAESAEELKTGARQVKVVAEKDLTDAEDDLRDSLYKQALSQVEDELEPQEALWPKIFSRNVRELNFSATAGQEASEFTATMDMEAVIIVFDENQLITAAREMMKKTLPPAQQLVGLNPRNFVYEVERFNLDSGSAVIKAKLEGRSALQATTDLLDKSNLTGKTEEEIQEFFSDVSGVQKVEVSFNPAWLKKTPRIQDKIIIKIAE